jgi:hypothetical protein
MIHEPETSVAQTIAAWPAIDGASLYRSKYRHAGGRPSEASVVILTPTGANQPSPFGVLAAPASSPPGDLLHRVASLHIV